MRDPSLDANISTDTIIEGDNRTANTSTPIDMKVLV